MLRLLQKCRNAMIAIDIDYSKMAAFGGISDQGCDSHVGASLDVMKTDALRMRGARPFIFTNIKAGVGVNEIAEFVLVKGGLRDQALAERIMP